MEKYLFMEMVLGLSAGLSPGPLLALVISETIRLGIGAGIRVAIAPLISDIPVLIISFLLVFCLSGSDPVLGIISLARGCPYFENGHFKHQNYRADATPQSPGRASASLIRLVMVNFGVNSVMYTFITHAQKNIKSSRLLNLISMESRLQSRHEL